MLHFYILIVNYQRDKLRKQSHLQFQQRIKYLGINLIKEMKDLYTEVKASACNAGDLGSIPESGRSPREGNGNPLQYSCLENPKDRAAWWASVHGVTKSLTGLSN